MNQDSRLGFLARTRHVIKLGGGPSWGSIQRLATDLETAGWDALLIPEHHDESDAFCRSPLLVSTFALGATARLGAGPGILPVSLYPGRLVPELMAFLELGGSRALLGLGVGFWSPDFEAIEVDRPWSWRELRSLTESLLEQGVPGSQILLGVSRPRNITWAGENGVGVLIGAAWMSERSFLRTADAYDEARQGDRAKGCLATIAGATASGGPRLSRPGDDVPVPPHANGLWWGRTNVELLTRSDLLILAPYDDGSRSFAEFLTSAPLQYRQILSKL
jgi:Luciferase-like monooxygenase